MDLLYYHPRLDANLRTPISNIHPLHFVTALHDPALLLWLAAFIPGGCEAAGTTALGHTLPLHIAALPFTAQQIVACPEIIKTRSIVHCSARTLDSTTWKPHRLPSQLHMDFSTPEDTIIVMGSGRKPIPMTVPQQLAQQGTNRGLLEALRHEG